MEKKVYLGRFGEEKYLFDMLDEWPVPNKNDFIFYCDVIYKVLYVMHDVQNNVVDVFVRMAIEEDY